MEMVRLFYNFCFPTDVSAYKNYRFKNYGFKNYGFYYLKQEENLLYSHTEFNTPNGPYQNIFHIQFEGDKVLAFKHNNKAWVKVEPQHHPTSAYPLLLPRVGKDALHYTMLSEDKNEVLGEAVLKREGNEIIESLGDKTLRCFNMQSDTVYGDSVPEKIDWGGAVSFLCSDEIEAVEGTNFKIDTKILAI